jgi:hypothetical protein
MVKFNLRPSTFVLTTFSCSAAAQRFGNFVCKVLKLYYVDDLQI